jgi:hypothetical protein
MPMKTSATSVVFRWTLATAKRGHRSLRQRPALSAPMTVEADKRRSATTPEPRVRYQRAVTPRASR